jgi:hypothetical protein
VALNIWDFFSMSICVETSLVPPTGKVMLTVLEPLNDVMVSSAGVFKVMIGIEMDINIAHRMVIMIFLMLSKPSREDNLYE